MPKAQNKKRRNLISQAKGSKDSPLVLSPIVKDAELGSNKTTDFTWGIIGNLVASILISFSEILLKKYFPKLSDDTLNLMSIVVPLCVFLLMLTVIAIIKRLNNLFDAYRLPKVQLLVIVILSFGLVYLAPATSAIVQNDYFLVIQKFLAGAGFGLIFMIIALLSRREGRKAVIRGSVRVAFVSGAIGIATPIIISPIVNFIILSLAQITFLLFLGRKRRQTLEK